MMSIKRSVIALLLSALSVMPAVSARAWEAVDRAPAPIEHQMAQSDEAVTAVADGYLYLSLRQRTAVKLFTVLGQPVVQDTLSPGVYRIRLTTRGIYLLKIGSATRRITV